MDERFTRLSSLEFRLVRPIVPLITLFQLPGGEGQFATMGGTVSFVNDSLKIARRLPRPLDENGAIWIRSTRTTASQIVVETSVRPDLIRDTLSQCIANHHPAFPLVELAEDNLAELAATNVNDVVVAPPPPDVTAEEEEASERNSAAERNELYGPDSRHVLLMDVPEGVNKLDVLRSLFGSDASNVPGEAEARPGDAGMLRRDVLQPQFPVEDLVNDIELGRSIFMRVFPQHFTDGKGGLEQAPDELTESEFVECCLFYHTRQFSTDKEFVAFACKGLFFFLSFFN